jgi:hypothetical protein
MAKLEIDRGNDLAIISPYFYPVERLPVLLFNKFCFVDGISIVVFDVQLVGTHFQGLQVLQRDLIYPPAQASSEHPDNPSVLNICQEDDAIFFFFAYHFDTDEIFEGIRVN